LGIVAEINEIYTVLFQSRAVADVLDTLRTYFEYVTECTPVTEEASVSEIVVIEPDIFRKARILFASESAIIGQSARVLVDLQRSSLGHPAFGGRVTETTLHEVWDYAIFTAAFATFPFLLNISNLGHDYTAYAPYSKEEIENRKARDRISEAQANQEWADDLADEEREEQRLTDKGLAYVARDSSRHMGAVWADGNRPYPTTPVTLTDTHGDPDDYITLSRVDRTTH
jgi:hypothetical protein